MTQSISICACSVCVSVIVSVLLKILMPQGSTKRLMSVILGIFVLLTLLTPLSELIGEFGTCDITKELDINISSAEKKIDDKILQSTGDYISAYGYSVLEKAGITPKNIVTRIGVDGDGGIYIMSLDIYMDEHAGVAASDISGLFKELMNIEPNIIIG